MKMQKGYFFLKKMWVTLRGWFLIALVCMNGMVPCFICMETKNATNKEYVFSKILYGSALPVMLLGLMLLLHIFFDEDGVELLYIKSKRKLHFVLTLELAGVFLSAGAIIAGIKYVEHPAAFLLQYVSILFLFGGVYYIVIYSFSSNLLAVFTYLLFFTIPFLFPGIKSCLNYMVLQKHPEAYAWLAVVCFFIGAIINNRKNKY